MSNKTAKKSLTNLEWFSKQIGTWKIQNIKYELEKEGYTLDFINSSMSGYKDGFYCIVHGKASRGKKKIHFIAKFSISKEFQNPLKHYGELKEFILEK